MSYGAIEKRFTKEKKALVPDRDFVAGHPLERRIRKSAFKAGLKRPGYDAVNGFNLMLQTPIRTVVSKTYTDLFAAFRHSADSLFATPEEQEEHLEWLFEELEKYQQDAKALILKHYRERQAIYAAQQKQLQS